jgi:hypothetical protein
MKIDWCSVGLGNRPDRIIALELGVSRRKVCGERLKLKISPFCGLNLNQEGKQRIL